ncbi:MAG TPA: hypothetical protein VK453_13530 [Micromonosporaceae bacterium]|nr:hypothetical protein [Micromonosporaceae bacterium]
MAKPARVPTADRNVDRVPLEISYAEIRAAYDSGDATPLSNVITDIARYRNHWWIAHTHTWLLITDEPTITKLDRHSQWSNPTLLRPVGDE